MERVDDWDGRDGRADRSHAFVKLVLGLVCADDGPCGTIVDHLLVGFFRARRCLKTNNNKSTGGLETIHFKVRLVVDGNFTWN